MKNKLPKYWIVKNDRSKLFRNTVIEYLNTIDSWYWYGLGYFWFDWNKNYNWTNWWASISEFENNPTLLTIGEFRKMTAKKDAS